MTYLTDQEIVRQIVGDKAIGLDDELMLDNMLGLMEISDEPTELWNTHCSDPDCTSCGILHDYMSGVLVEVPKDWDSETVLRKLHVLGHTCEGGNRFAHAVGVIDFINSVNLADIRLK